MRSLKSVIGDRSASRPGWLFLAVMAYLVLVHWKTNVLAAQHVVVHPGEDIQTLVSRYPPGSTFQITPGTYRLQSIRPKNGDSFIGQPGSILTGAVLLTSFAKHGGYWVTSVSVKPQDSYPGKCDTQHPACRFPEDLFLDGGPLQRVSALSDLAPGKWYLDYATQKAYLGSDPGGHVIEMSSQRAAFWGNAGKVTIKGLTIEKYASLAGRGAITPVAVLAGYGPVGRDWVVDNNNVFLNHGAGIHASDGMVIRNNKIHDNGQIGVVGGGSNVIIEGNDIFGNNYAGYAYDWQAGGANISYFCSHVTFSNNYVHDNKGPGLHGDIADDDFTFEGNHTARNLVSGILYEISYHAVIRNNLIEDDGFSPGGTSLLYGAGILILNSSDVEVYGNTVTDCMNGIGGTETNRGNNPKTHSPFELRNIYVHNNIITQNTGTAAGILKSGSPDNSVFTSWKNRFDSNTFHLANKAGRYFQWMNTAQTLPEWENKRQDNQSKMEFPVRALPRFPLLGNLVTVPIEQLLFTAF